MIFAVGVILFIFSFNVSESIRRDISEHSSVVLEKKDWKCYIEVRKMLCLVKLHVAVRLLLHARCSDYGQTSYVLPFIVNRLDHLPVFSLSLGSLFAIG